MLNKKPVKKVRRAEVEERPAVKKAAAKPAGRGDALAKARAARTAAGGKPAAKKAAATTRTPKKVFTYKPPEDMKPFFMDVKFRTGADGLPTHSISCERVRGRWDNEAAKRFDMFEYDAKTVAAFMGRLGGKLFAPNPEKRLPGNTTFRVIVRVAVRKSEKLPAPTLAARVTNIARYTKSAKTGKLIAKWLEDAKDADRRRIRAVSRFLGGAFTNVQLPPSGRRTKADEE